MQAPTPEHESPSPRRARSRRPFSLSEKIAIVRETLAYADGLADFAFAMQGLGTGAISLSGSDEIRQRVLPAIARGELISAFALSEPNAGSDVAAMSSTARREGDSFVLDGEKIWISNGGIADVYTVFARTGEAPGTRGISAFVVFADTPGFSIAERIETIARRTGFGDEDRMRNTFQRHLNVSPRDYRERFGNHEPAAAIA